MQLTNDSIKSCLDQIKTDFSCDLNYGFIQEDSRLSRRTKTLIGYNLTIDKKELAALRTQKPESKFIEDWKRMYHHYKVACQLLKDDPNTRRAVILNTHDYNKIYECFLVLEVVKDRDGYTMCVYQRAGDLIKLIPDLVFYTYVCKKIEKEVPSVQITKLLVRYGHAHKELK